MKNKHLCLACGGKHKKYYTAGIKKAKFKDIVNSATKVLSNSLYEMTDKVLFDVLKDDPKFLKNSTSSLVFTGNANLRDAEDKAINTAKTVAGTLGTVANQVGMSMLTGSLAPKPNTLNTDNMSNPVKSVSPTNTYNTTNQTGGLIPVKGGILKKLSSTGIQAIGNTHDNGGIMLDENTEIENNEGVHDINNEVVISSDVLKNEKTGKSFAKDMTKLEKDKGHYEALLEQEYKKTNNKENYNTILYKKRISQIEEELAETFEQQEKLAKEMGLRDENGMPNETSQELVGNEEAIQGLQDEVEQAAYGGIHIKEENKGKFTKKAENAGLPVQSFANKVLANKEDYTTNTIKQAVFAKNATKFKHELGGLTEKDYLGYKNNSPYKDSKSLVINSSDITMKDVKVPILGVSDKGDIKYMSPENNYKFKGSKVLEIPIKAQTGLKFKQKLDVTPYDIDYLKLIGNRDSKLQFEKPIITQLLEDKPAISKKSPSFNKPLELLKTPEIKGDIFNSQFKDKLNRTANFKLKDYSPEAPTDNKFKLSNEQKLILSGIGASFINNTKKQAELEKYLKNHGYTNPYKLESMYTDRRNYYNNIEPLITNRDIQNNITSSVNAAIQQGNVNNPALNNLMAKGIKLYNDSVITSRANSNKFLDDATDKLANYSSQKQIADNMLNMQRNKQKGELISNQVTLQDKLIKDAIEQGILKPNDDKAYLEYLKKYLVLQNSESGRKALDAKANLGLKLGGYIKNK